ncbi:succinoglycan biosynthesis protein exoi [Rhizobium binxianense]|uniref:sunset domain-containing protein n=1 Tax=Rhizobium binxianense TaxID=3024242 RepID=UPI00235F3EAD|nr:succinoglycan biosynthesis protein exoi [Rhizobium sp. MC62]MDC9808515.1 succinoglycan biosynthesis protein exoi [Rhizobium sp. MC62]
MWGGFRRGFIVKKSKNTPVGEIYGRIDKPAAGSRGSGQSCKIKGNISIGTGERIFHVPGQRYYEQTEISPKYGERWFCSEFEAWAAGWRKSKA